VVEPLIFIPLILLGSGVPFSFYFFFHPQGFLNSPFLLEALLFTGFNVPGWPVFLFSAFHPFFRVSLKGFFPISRCVGFLPPGIFSFFLVGNFLS